jgi:hypothetical protein
MADFIDVIDQAIGSVTTLRRVLAKGTSVQVTGQDERTLAKATALTWIREGRGHFGPASQSEHLQAVDNGFRDLLEFTDRSTTRERYKTHIKNLRAQLVSLRSDVIANPAIAIGAATGTTPPDWSRLVPDPNMQAILTRRWEETVKCLNAEASLAATVMMGAMLEAILLSRVNHLHDKAPLFKTSACPKDSKSGKALPLQVWTLQHYIDVAHEMGWIRQAARDVGVVLRDYRNYIHPSKELSHGIKIENDDAQMFWVVFQSLADQIARSV